MKLLRNTARKRRSAHVETFQPCREKILADNLSAVQVFVSMFPTSKSFNCVKESEGNLTKVRSFDFLADLFTSDMAPNCELLPQLNNTMSRLYGREFACGTASRFRLLETKEKTMSHYYEVTTVIFTNILRQIMVIPPITYRHRPLLVQNQRPCSNNQSSFHCQLSNHLTNRLIN